MIIQNFETYGIISYRSDRDLRNRLEDSTGDLDQNADPIT